MATAQPVDDRFTWIKGAATFDALRQACIDPGDRAYVGAEPPKCAMPSQVISEVEITQASWAVTPRIPLNPGLVAIVGARGSGKTALTDVIAAGCERDGGRRVAQIIKPHSRHNRGVEYRPDLLRLAHAPYRPEVSNPSSPLLNYSKKRRGFTRFWLLSPRWRVSSEQASLGMPKSFDAL